MTHRPSSVMSIGSGLLPGQVLQVGPDGTASCRILGRCTGQGPVVATWSSRGLGSAPQVAGHARRGRFVAKIAGIPAGGPYAITLRCAGQVLTVRDVRAGEVWILAGQSNMEGIGNLSGAMRAPAAVRSLGMDGVWAHAEDPLIHLPASTHPVHNRAGVRRDEARRLRRLRRKGVGPGIPFAIARMRATRLPQGLIGCAHGGTALDAWDPGRRGTDALYGSLLATVRATCQPVAGLLWYQGESDADPRSHARYLTATIRLVQRLRRDLGQRDLPAALVQLGRWTAGDPSTHAAWESVREQQRILPGRLRRTGLATAVDLPLDDPIHIGADGQRMLGARLAAAMARAEGRDDAPAALLPRAARRILIGGPGSRTEVIEVPVSGAVGRLRLADQPSIRIDCPGWSGYPYRTELHEDRIRLWCAGLPSGRPLNVTLGCGSAPCWSLRDGRGEAMPAVAGIVVPAVPGVGPWITAWSISRPAPRPGGPMEGWSASKLPVPDRQVEAPPDGMLWMNRLFPRRSGIVVLEHRLAELQPAGSRLWIGSDGVYLAGDNRSWLLHGSAGFNAALDGLDYAVWPGLSDRIRIVLDLNEGGCWGLCARFSSDRSRSRTGPRGPAP